MTRPSFERLFRRFAQVLIQKRSGGVLRGSGLALACAGLGGCGETSLPPCNVLLISIDSLRADHLGCYGYESPTGLSPSPRLDQLAEQGILFESTLSTTSWTMPSHHALFSGLPDLVHGATDDWHGPSPDRPVLAQRLLDRGYRTAGYFSGPYLQPQYGFAKGFEEYENVTALPMQFDIPKEERDLGAIERSFHEAATARQVTSRGEEFLREQSTDAPFFLFLHYFDVHYDYAPPREQYAERFRPGRRPPQIDGRWFMENPDIHPEMDPRLLEDVLSYYDGEIYWVDSQLGILFDTLEELGLQENTLVAVVADHGDEFFEHGQKGHRKTLYQESLRIPLILRWPAKWEGPHRVPNRVSIVDVAPTILECIGVATPRVSPSATRGTSLIGLIDGSETGRREQLGFLRDRSNKDRPVEQWALWTGPYMVSVTLTGGNAVPVLSGEIYDLEKDPEERNNLRDSRDPAVEAAIDRFHIAHEAARRAAGNLSAGSPPSFTDEEFAEQREKLEALGYAVDTVSAQSLIPRFPRQESR